MSLDPGTLTQMDSAVTQLRQHLAQARSSVASQTSFPGLGAAQDTAQNALDNNYGPLVDRITGPDYQSVLDGSMDADAWMSEAKSCDDSIRSVAPDIAPFSIGNAAGGIASGTLRDLKHLGDGLGAGLGAGITAAMLIYAVTAIVVVFLLLKYGRAVPA